VLIKRTLSVGSLAMFRSVFLVRLPRQSLLRSSILRQLSTISDAKGHDAKGHDAKGHDAKGHDAKGHDEGHHDSRHGRHVPLFVDPETYLASLTPHKPLEPYQYVDAVHTPSQFGWLEGRQAMIDLARKYVQSISQLSRGNACTIGSQHNCNSFLVLVTA